MTTYAQSLINMNIQDAKKNTKMVASDMILRLDWAIYHPSRLLQGDAPRSKPT